MPASRPFENRLELARRINVLVIGSKNSYFHMAVLIAGPHAVW
jgi:hypothetical protein